MSEMMYYFPTNREEVLSILASVSFNFKTTPLHIQVAMASKVTPYQFSESIDINNEVIALSTNERNFPVLIAFSNKIKKSQINFSEIHYLVFRTEQEKDDFRFRAVSEFDTECINWVVRPELFQPLQKNHQKFTRKDLENAPNYHSRIISGLLNLRHVASWKGFDAVAFDQLFQKDELSIQLLIQLVLDLTGSEIDNKLSEHLMMAIIQSILEHGKLNSVGLLQKINDKWSELWGADVPPQDEVIWFKYLTSIINSTQVLNLDKLTDDGGSVFLRAATLMIMSDDLNVLKNFSDQSSRIGTKVLYLAAFLIGLKTSLHRRSWQDKKNAIALIEECAGIVDSKKISKLARLLKNSLYLAQAIWLKSVQVETYKLDIYHMKQRYYRIYAEGIKTQGTSVDVWNYDRTLKAYYVDWVNIPNIDELETLISLI
ncbi:hypothetical protein [Acinetobacter sp. YH12136]|uniref:hypothetical protein n=1 Tax=Acinetobacter sp. YH12136 TaxID=2601120 RepID=UPI0015D2D7F3|nr:hypothetical protein [Acinetobacter sp. YH12136]